MRKSYFVSFKSVGLQKGSIFRRADTTVIVNEEDQFEARIYLEEESVETGGIGNDNLIHLPEKELTTTKLIFDGESRELFEEKYIESGNILDSADIRLDNRYE